MATILSVIETQKFIEMNESYKEWITSHAQQCESDKFVQSMTNSGCDC